MQSRPGLPSRERARARKRERTRLEATFAQALALGSVPSSMIGQEGRVHFGYVHVHVYEHVHVGDVLRPP